MRFSSTLIAAGLLTNAALAFKPATHIFIGQQVLNDALDDGRVTLAGHAYNVDPVALAALRSDPGAYRMGNVGPDAFPDIVTGQMLPHPGVDNGWATNDWMRWLLQGALESNSNQARAFSYGYLGHVSGDVFAHTYINQAAGNVFVLTDGEREVEARHVTLESYIDTHRPPLVNEVGRSLGEPYAPGILEWPTPFLVERLITSPTAQEQNLKGKMAPLVALAKLREAVVALEKETGNLSRASRAYVAGSRSREANVQMRLDAYERLKIDNDRELSRKKDARDGRLAAYQMADRALAGKRQEIARQRQTLEQNRARVKELMPEWQTATRLANEAAATYDQTKVTFDTFKVKDWFTLVFGGSKKAKQELNDRLWLAASRLQAARERREQIDMRKTAADAAVDTAVAQLAAEDLAYQGLESAFSRAKEAYEAAQRAVDEFEDASRRFQGNIEAAAREITEIIARNTTLGGLGLDALHSYALNWRDGIDLAIAAYIDASGETMVQIMRPKDDPDHPTEERKRAPQKPFLDWTSQWSPVLLGVPYQATGAVAGVKDFNEAISENRRVFRLKVGEAKWVLDPLGSIDDEVTRVTDKYLKPALQDEAIRLVGDFTRGDNAGFLAALSETATRESLDRVFASDESKTGLPVYGRVSEKIDADLHLDAQGRFDPERFAPVHNAIALAKLSLLGPVELNRLAKDCGVGSTLYGPTLYPETGDLPTPALFDWILSIDGDYQWKSVSPGYRRADGSVAPPEKPFGEGFGAGSGKGFRFYADETARRLVFEKLFIEPYAPRL